MSDGHHALEGKDHNSVMVCSRGSDGWSKATRLTDFPDYFEVVGRGPLGTAAVRDRLRPSEVPTLLGDGRLGTGDVAILVERDQFKQSVAHTGVEVWTFDNELSAYG